MSLQMQIWNYSEIEKDDCLVCIKWRVFDDSRDSLFVQTQWRCHEKGQYRWFRLRCLISYGTCSYGLCWKRTVKRLSLYKSSVTFILKCSSVSHFLLSLLTTNVTSPLILFVCMCWDILLCKCVKSVVFYRGDV